jgi:hypothetical protein
LPSSLSIIKLCLIIYNFATNNDHPVSLNDTAPVT